MISVSHTVPITMECVNSDLCAPIPPSKSRSGTPPSASIPPDPTRKPRTPPTSCIEAVQQSDLKALDTDFITILDIVMPRSNVVSPRSFNSAAYSLPLSWEIAAIAALPSFPMNVAATFIV